MLKLERGVFRENKPPTSQLPCVFSVQLPWTLSDPWGEGKRISFWFTDAWLKSNAD